MSEKGHFVASSDIVEEKVPSPLPPPLTRIYENSEHLVNPQEAIETNAAKSAGEESDERSLKAQVKHKTDSECIDKTDATKARVQLDQDDHLRNIMNSFQRAVTPHPMDVSHLLPRFDGPQLKFPASEPGS
ncbi:MAG: hypothetical protein K2W95_08790 [Candidatus Obscuribacterales bacterium]|nr:hypothetical protein [Candidatus Obscuribacterales bacterium]